MSMDVSALKGIGPKKAARLEKMHISTVEDLLYLFPRDYQDRRSTTAVADLHAAAAAMIHVVIRRVDRPFSYRRGKKNILRLRVEDASGSLEIIYFNAAYLGSRFHAGERMYFYGSPKMTKGRMQMIQPAFSEDMAQEGILPVYPLTAGIGEGEMRRIQRQAQQYISTMEDPLPETLRQEHGLVPLWEALSWIHFPPDPERLKKAKARFIYDELLTLQLGVQMMRRQTGRGQAMKASAEPFIRHMRFPLTGAQQRVIDEILSDMAQEKAMSRLVQGDVGSGKTAVAEAALFAAVKSGRQGALMVPSELLAKQHFANLAADYAHFGIRVGLLTGSMPAAEKQRQLAALQAGETDIIIGTHALLQPDVVFDRLGLVVTDEQHRFGVTQRKTLAEKGDTPDILVMTATPIPRTLAVVLYGDMDISVIDELPPGRKPILTKAVTEQARDKVYRFVGEEVAAGRQAYVVAPLVADSEVMEAKSAKGLYRELQQRFGSSVRVGLVHGEMRQEEKDAAMQAFAEGRCDVLVATVVIEVGIHVANASVMVIENSEHFGAAQLHQLRGRVGRGAAQSYCILLCGKNAGETARSRARIMTESSDGFYIAEQDLALRGPGEIFGERQHGLPDQKLISLLRRTDLMADCRKMAEDILQEDPGLQAHPLLRRRVERVFGADVRMII